MEPAAMDGGALIASISGLAVTLRTVKTEMQSHKQHGELLLKRVDTLSRRLYERGDELTTGKTRDVLELLNKHIESAVEACQKSRKSFLYRLLFYDRISAQIKDAHVAISHCQSNFPIFDDLESRLEDMEQRAKEAVADSKEREENARMLQGVSMAEPESVARLTRKLLLEHRIRFEEVEKFRLELGKEKEQAVQDKEVQEAECLQQIIELLGSPKPAGLSLATEVPGREESYSIPRKVVERPVAVSPGHHGARPGVAGNFGGLGKPAHALAGEAWMGAEMDKLRIQEDGTSRSLSQDGDGDADGEGDEGSSSGPTDAASSMHSDRSLQALPTAEELSGGGLGETARALWRTADEGDVAAQYKLGMRFQHGQGALIDATKAAKWYRVAAEQGHALAQCALGWCYFRGEGVGLDRSKAEELIGRALEGVRLAVEQGRADAQTLLGQCHQYGAGVPADLAKAVELFGRAADQGDAQGQCWLGLCYLDGTGVPTDAVKAAELFTLAAAQGNAHGQCCLGLCYLDGTGVPVDLARAAELFKKATEQGDAHGQCCLGLCYMDGRGVPTDLTKAADLFQMAAEQGDAQAQCWLGQCYRHGKGVDRNPTKAARAFRKAADQGNAQGQCFLGLCYQNGIGVRKDLTRAANLYRMAADQGDVLAQWRVAHCYQTGEGFPRDLSKAAKWYKTAANQVDGQGQGSSVHGPLAGVGALKDITKTAKLYRMSSEQTQSVC